MHISIDLPLMSMVRIGARGLIEVDERNDDNRKKKTKQSHFGKIIRSHLKCHEKKNNNNIELQYLQRVWNSFRRFDSLHN